MQGSEPQNIEKTNNNKRAYKTKQTNKQTDKQNNKTRQKGPEGPQRGPEAPPPHKTSKLLTNSNNP